MSPPVDRLNAALADRYRIERELGEGGMATVYLAEDLRHDRRVAIKVLRPELAALVGAERFLAEIKTTANLQHPHVLPLFDSGEADGFLFYVMPYVEGESLRERLDRERQLPVEEAVAIGRKVASALHYAHEQGIVHRDVKPANVLLSRGEPLVADFGIALAVSQAGGGRITETGLSLGTPHYMSPEQASGEQMVDRRTDVYALGCVLYEMLTGEPPHTGPTGQAILARILTGDPRRVADVRKAVPSHVDAAVARALEKLPADRFASVVELADALDDRSFRYAAGREPPGTSDGGPWRTKLVYGAAGLVGGALLVVAASALLGPDAGSGARSVPVPTSRFVVDLEHPVRGSELDLSRDGEMLVYATADEDEPLYLRHMDELEARPVPGTEGGAWPAFSPDGEWIAFQDSAEVIRRIAVTGGDALQIASGLETPFALHWEGDGTLLFSSRDGIYRVSARGGNPERILEGGDYSLRFPRLFPGGGAMLFSEFDRVGPGGIGNVQLLDLASGETTVLVEEGSNAQYVETGHLVYGHSSGTVFALPFDVERREVTGDPFPVLEGARVDLRANHTGFAASSVGTLVYLRGGSSVLPRSTLVVTEGSSRRDTLPVESPELWAPRFSPDGRRLVYEDQRQIYVYDLIVGTNTQITSDGLNELPVWTPGGDSIVFARDHEGSSGRDLFRAAADGEGDPMLLWEEGGSEWPEAWAPDGRLLLYTSTSASNSDNEDLKILDLGGEPESTMYLNADWNEYRGRISPDGRWVAYESDEDGTNAVYVRSFPEPGPKTRVSEGGGRSSRWSPDGGELYYWRADTLVVARVRTEPSFEVVSRSNVLVGSYEEEFDIRPDGSGFVFTESASLEAGGADEGEGAGEGRTGTEEGSAELIVVVNWFEELLRRAGRTGGRP